MKLEVKKELVPICFFYFFLFLSFGLVFPYFTLQLLTLGLSLDDAALIGGLHITFYYIISIVINCSIQEFKVGTYTFQF